MMDREEFALHVVVLVLAWPFVLLLAICYRPRTALVVALLLLVAIVVRANAAPPANADPALSSWFEGLKQPGTGTSCCSLADCRPVDYRSGPKGYEVWVDMAWRPVPADKVLDGKDNPIGRAVVCYTPALGVLCFVRGTEA